MSNQSNRRIITNRQLNFTLCPVDTYNKKEMPYSLPNYSIDGTWNQHQSIILDVLLDRLYNDKYSKLGSLPRSWRSQKVLDVISEFDEGAINPENLEYISQPPFEAYKKSLDKDTIENYRYSFQGSMGNEFNANEFEKYLKKFSGYRSFKEDMEERTRRLYVDEGVAFITSNLFRDYPVLKKYRYNLYDYVKRISEVKFKMNYKVKFIDVEPGMNEKTKRYSRGNITDIYYNMMDSEQIFTAEFDKDAFAIYLKSPLGKMVLHNTLILDTDWITESALKLTKNAYFIYKRFVLNRVAGGHKAEEIRLWFSDIKSFLDIHWDNNSGVHKSIDKAFKEMLAKGLADGYSWNNDHIGQRQYVLTFEHQKKGVEKQQDNGDKLLKVPT
ncbi:hypothetical protein DSCW_51080 [Desulfosarcina widdelii]|uniref:Uncharacterized protein n=1 Tax=Desulfosarcina widdelii TaxID=947919 RepID=A0A5K7ZD82_9BACT|nr:hypothetical protein [Desulfosarcina widdelii]BBO77691.1 hypothetical protein DSCW_51080 [Desulfosarcina widdelii]